MNYVPDGYQAITPYLIVADASRFIAFMKEVFGAKELNRHKRNEGTVMHGEVKVGDSIIMFADSTPEYVPMTAPLFIYVENADATYPLALDKGATPVTPLGDQPYGRSGGVKDPHGNTWWITSVQK